MIYIQFIYVHTKTWKGVKTVKIENIAVFALGNIGYGFLELLWRGRTHWTMMITGGICLLTLYRMEQHWKQEMLVFRCIKGAVLITCIEFLIGILVNRIMKWNVWDYSRAPGNLLGQICPLYFLFWYFLCYPVFGLTGLLQKAWHRTH